MSLAAVKDLWQLLKRFFATKENESDFYLPAQRRGGSLTVITSSSFLKDFISLSFFLATSSCSLSSLAEQHRQLQQLQLPPLFREQKSSEVPVPVVMELLEEEVSESSAEDDELWWW